MHLILLRHTRTATSDAVCYGDSDVPLPTDCEATLHQAIANVPTFDHICSSPLIRCAQLAQEAARRTSLPVEYNSRLKEMNFGHWQGKRWEEIARGELDEWAAHFETAKPHGGESVIDLRARVQELLADLSSRFGSDERILLVTHAGVIRSILTIIGQQTDSKADERDHQIDYGQWRKAEYSVR